MFDNLVLSFFFNSFYIVLENHFFIFYYIVYELLMIGFANTSKCIK